MDPLPIVCPRVGECVDPHANDKMVCCENCEEIIRCDPKSASVKEKEPERPLWCLACTAELKPLTPVLVTLTPEGVSRKEKIVSAHQVFVRNGGAWHPDGVWRNIDAVG